MKRKMEQFPAKNPNPVLSAAKDGTVLYSNKASESLLLEWGTGVGEKLPSSIVDIVQRVISRNSPEKMEIKAENGIYLVVISPLSEQEGVNISGFDISDQKGLEEKLWEDEAHCKVAEAIEAERRRLYDVLETLPVMICLLTSDYRIAFANRSFRKKFGESEGRHCYEFRFKRIRPCEFCEVYKTLETGKSQKWEVTIPDGRVLEVYYLPFTDVDGSPMILEMDIDITERKKAEEKLRDSEEKYRNIVETSNEGIYFVNDEAKVTFANKMMETSGYSLDEIIGRAVWNFIPEESLLVAKKEFEKRRKGISGSYELKLIRKDGSYIWVYHH
jgi:PAS domain S-box-containing protein